MVGKKNPYQSHLVRDANSANTRETLYLLIYHTINFGYGHDLSQVYQNYINKFNVYIRKKSIYPL